MNYYRLADNPSWDLLFIQIFDLNKNRLERVVEE